MEKLCVYSYNDYRKYLSDFFEAEKKRNPKFSHRGLANRLGLSTSNFILLVMQGKRNLGPSTLSKLSEVLKQDNDETEYFENLVNFCHAEVPRDKERYYKKMMAFRRNLKIDLLDDRQYEYYDQWYHSVVRELVVEPEFAGDMKTLAARVSPAITVNEAKQSVALLLKLGLIKRKGYGFEQASPFISTGPEVKSVAVPNFHRKMATLASEAVDRYPRDARHFSACTIRVSEKGYKAISEKIADFRKEVMYLVSLDQDTDRVYQMNFQLFPLSRSAKKEKP